MTVTAHPMSRSMLGTKCRGLGMTTGSYDPVGSRNITSVLLALLRDPMVGSNQFIRPKL